MMIISYENFCQILNQNIFESSKVDLLTKIADSPTRYIGLFRPTRPKAKLLQNLLQSHEIRFGNAFEKLIRAYFQAAGYEILPSKQIFSGEDLDIDQHLIKDDIVYFVEQKVRDDHDSSKKRGQISNFENKIELLCKLHENKKMRGFFYFIDPSLLKNKNFYATEIQTLSKDYDVELNLCYGKELFLLNNMPCVWNEIITYLKNWKESIPEIPNLNFDANPDKTFVEIKDIPASKYRKLLLNDEIYNEILLTLFPEKKTLKLLYSHFNSQKLPIYKRLAELLAEKLAL